MTTLIVFILVLGLLVFVHEFGHFIAARKTGMKVHEFALGFPPYIIGFYKDPKTKKIVWVPRDKAKRDLLSAGGGKENVLEYPATLYALNLLPLGGYVKIKGENGEDENEPDSFGYQKTWKKIIALVAGVSMNFLLAGVLLGIGFCIGLPMDVSQGLEKNAILVSEPSVSVQQVQADSSADKAGLKMADNLLQIDTVQLENTQMLVDYVAQNPTKEMHLVYQRGEQMLETNITPTLLENEETPRLGVMLAEAAIVRYPWYISIYKGFVAAGIMTLQIFVGFYDLLKNIIIGQGLVYDVSGPVGIATLVGDSYRLGISYLINVTAMISLSLAVINILPIPALDGGRVVFVIIEKFTKKKLPLKYEQIAHTIGFVALMLLIVVVTVKDVLKLF
ncbi:MAG: RIP metalloprotease RseP [Candidatus Magasanikbacteria bacterium]